MLYPLVTGTRDADAVFDDFGTIYDVNAALAFAGGVLFGASVLRAPGGKRGATMAVTIDAPPSRLWPWLVQMGCDRAGWYSWDRLDNAGAPSADPIHPEWQDLALRDRLASSPSGSTWFGVAAIEPIRSKSRFGSRCVQGVNSSSAGPADARARPSDHDVSAR